MVVLVDAVTQEGSSFLHLNSALLHINLSDVLWSPLECRCYFAVLDRVSWCELSVDVGLVYLWVELDKGLRIHSGGPPSSLME